jgi:hypothetical protein
MKVKRTGVTKKGLPFTSYRISNEPKFVYKPKFFTPSGRGRTFSIYDYGTDILWFQKRHYDTKANNFENMLTCFLKYKNGRFTFYMKKDKGIINISNSAKSINSFLPSYPGAGTKTNLHAKRVYRVLKEFGKRHGVEFPKNKKVPHCDIAAMVQYLCYPGLRKFYGEIQTSNIHNTVSRQLRKDQDFKLVIKKFFGSKGDKITKSVYNRILRDKSLRVLTLGKLFKGLIPLDYFFKLLESNLNTGRLEERLNLEKLRFLFAKYPADRILKLMSQETDGQYFDFGYLYTDSAEIYFKHHTEIELPKAPKTIVELHDYLSGEQAKLRHKNRPIPLSDKLKEIDGAKVDDLEIEVARDTHTLVHWGQKMKHCIGSYADRALEGDYVLLGLKKDGQLVYNISLYRGTIDQFKGFANKYPSPEDERKVVNFLKEKKLLSKLQEDFISSNRYYNQVEGA